MDKQTEEISIESLFTINESSERIPSSIEEKLVLTRSQPPKVKNTIRSRNSDIFKPSFYETASINFLSLKNIEIKELGLETGTNVDCEMKENHEKSKTFYVIKPSVELMEIKLG